MSADQAVPRGAAADTSGQPRRVRRRRVKGWRMPANTVYVGRGSRWGNPFRVEAAPADGRTPVTTEDAVRLFERWLADPAPTSHPVARARLLDSLADLRGHHLACWCPLTDPAGQPVACHADVLLTLANTTDTAGAITLRTRCLLEQTSASAPG